MGDGGGRRGLRNLISAHRSARKSRDRYANAEVGEKLLELILGSPDWIHRRVEGLEILPSGDSLRRQSVDFTLPSDLAITGSKGKVLLPISLMKKGPLSKFSATGPDDRSIAVLETSRNGQLAVDMLLTLASHSYGFPVGTALSEARELLEQIVLGSSSDVLTVLDRLDSVLSDASEESPGATNHEFRDVFRAIAAQFGGFFLLVFEVSEGVRDQRSLIKFSYLESREDGHGKPRFPARWEFNDFGLSASFHVEFEPPPLLRIALFTLVVQIGDGGPTITRDITRSPGRVVHIASSPPGPLSTAAVVFELVPRQGGVAGASWTAVRIVCGFFFLVLVGRCLRSTFLGPVPLASPAAAAVLVASGGVLLTWLSRVPEEWIVAKVLASPRNHLFAASLVLLGAAFLMVLPVPEPWRSFVWVALWLSSVIVLAFSWLFRRRSKIRTSPEQARREALLPAETDPDGNVVDQG